MRYDIPGGPCVNDQFICRDILYVHRCGEEGYSISCPHPVRYESADAELEENSISPDSAQRIYGRKSGRKFF